MFHITLLWILECVCKCLSPNQKRNTPRMKQCPHSFARVLAPIFISEKNRRKNEKKKFFCSFDQSHYTCWKMVFNVMMMFIFVVGAVIRANLNHSIPTTQYSMDAGDCSSRSSFFLCIGIHEYGQDTSAQPIAIPRNLWQTFELFVNSENHISYNWIFKWLILMCFALLFSQKFQFDNEHIHFHAFQLCKWKFEIKFHYIFYSL